MDSQRFDDFGDKEKLPLIHIIKPVIQLSDIPYLEIYKHKLYIFINHECVNFNTVFFSKYKFYLMLRAFMNIVWFYKNMWYNKRIAIYSTKSNWGIHKKNKKKTERITLTVILSGYWWSDMNSCDGNIIWRKGTRIKSVEGHESLYCKSKVWLGIFFGSPFTKHQPIKV